MMEDELQPVVVEVGAVVVEVDAVVVEVEAVVKMKRCATEKRAAGGTEISVCEPCETKE
ncbi:hypothetical protein JGG81_24935 [Salmonella enterica subsp. enterica serovar Typhimurium]|nr:hypothetical protein [Salmonella enterica subsp. enterica serovar Typhimurium]